MTVMKANIVHLTPATREFLKVVNFPEIPPEANYICFFEDGDAQFLETLDKSAAGFVMPSFTMISYYKDVVLNIPED